MTFNLQPTGQYQAPFLDPLPNEIALHAIRYLTGAELLRLREVSRRANALVADLFKNVSYWRWLGFKEGQVPTKADLTRAFSLARSACPQPTILTIRESCRPMIWTIIKRLKLVSLDNLSNAREVAERAASFGDANLCEKALISQNTNLSNQELTQCMARAIQGGNLPTVEMLLRLGATPSRDNFLLSVRCGQMAIAQTLARRDPQLARSLSPLQWAAFCGDVNYINQQNPTPAELRGNPHLPSPLIFAASTGQVGAISALHQQGANVNENSGQTNALEEAARHGHNEAIRLLVQLGFSIQTKGAQAFFVATEFGRIDIIEELLRLGCPITATDNRGKTALHYAASNGSTDALKVLIDHQCPIAATDNHGGTALHYAVDGAGMYTVRELVRLGCPIDATNDVGRTALHEAGRAGQIDTFKELVRLGASIHATDQGGGTTLHIAASGEYAEAIEASLDLGCSMNATDSQGRSALHWAARYGESDCVEELVRLGSPTDPTDKAGRTPLHIAAMDSDIDRITDLRNLGCSSDKTDNHGRTAIHWAVIESDEFEDLKDPSGTIVALANFGCPVNASDKDGKTALHYAARNDYADAIDILVNLGCPINETDNQGQSALVVAAKAGHTEIMASLIRHGCRLPLEATSHDEEEIAKALEEGKSEVAIQDLCSKYNISIATYNIWRVVYPDGISVGPRVRQRRTQ